MAKQEFEYAYWRARIQGMVRPRVAITPYVPVFRQVPSNHLNVFSSWAGIESIIPDIIERFKIRTDCCLEFGVERGFSAVALSSYFKSVVGVDTFQGDRHTGFIRDIYEETQERLLPFKNIALVKSDYRDFIRDAEGFYGLIHVDIIHTFYDTFTCGLWSAVNSQCAIFHDTESFPQVKLAVREIARLTGKKFYNFDESYGLGILV